MFSNPSGSKMSQSELIKWRSRSIAFGVSVPLVVALILLYFNKDQILWPFQDHSNWKVTYGKIVSSSVEYRHGWRNFSWDYSIIYVYDVDKLTYSSNKIHYSYKGSSDKTYAEKYVAKYPVGAKVLVYFNPTNPAISVLEPDVKDYSNLLTIGGALVFGLYFIISSFWIR